MRDRKKLVTALGERTYRDTGTDPKWPRYTTAQTKAQTAIEDAILKGKITYGPKLQGLA